MEVRVEDLHSGPVAVALAGPIALCWNQMRIDPNGLIGGCPALVVRKALRHLRVWDQWGVAELEAAAALPPGHWPRSGQGFANGGTDRSLRTRRLVRYSGGTEAFGCIGGQAGHTGDRGESPG